MHPRITPLGGGRTVTYAELPPLLMNMLRTNNPDWGEDVLTAYERRLTAMFKRLERKQNHAAGSL